VTSLSENAQATEDDADPVVKRSATRTWLVLIAVVVVIALAAAALVAKHLISKIPTVVATQVRAGTVQASASGTGSIGAVTNVAITVNFPGLTDPLIVTKVNVVVGSVVTAGQSIATLDPIAIDNYLKELQTKVSDDKIAVSYSTTPLQRAEVQSALDVDQAQLTKVSKYSPTVTAPAAGVISSLVADVGTVLPSGRPIGNIVSLGSLRATISVPATQVGLLSIGETGTLTFPQLPGLTETATVQAISPGSTNQGLNVPITIVLNKVDPRLHIGLLAYVSFTQPISAPTALPLIAVHDPDGTPFVFTIDGSNRVHEQPVVVQAHDLTTAALTSGVAVGATVVMTNAQHLSDGDKVKVSKVQTP